MYTTLTGKPPFDGANPVQIILKQLNEAAPGLPKNLQQGKAAELEKVIKRCLEKDKKDRYLKVEELKADLESVARNQPIRYVPRRRRKKLAGVLILLFAACLVGSIFVYNQGHAPDAAPPPLEDITGALHEGKALQHFRERHYEQAIPLLEYVAATAKRRGELYREAFDYQCIGQCYLALGNFETAKPYYEKSLKLTNELVEKNGLDDQSETMLTETKTGYIAVLRALGHPAKALTVLKTLNPDRLEQLEDFYRNANVPNDEERVRGLRHELQSLLRSER
jgi:tetratricopeptide (TPR) repeat protein